ncbi:universal stress protein [Polymorphobacter fuscus]|uniref:Universal stress protein n=1 Tax=Sandarakinorhabdus fusca TaxID=1439888 RepID=A0A7C9GQX7_9SPHN|nr:universal stress protein [Polymorphobacter fuscus]KAB7645564.1 universal stress protein [Polymorphobacter fuscus]MQT18010.1 universal stress protein [Polymorphobacter fuscus]NJC08639.1 nucleotide-binding universal stress UspA family protein [Polymorphobacter fuscus]
MRHILACLDASAYGVSVIDLTAWVATRLSASVELLHVVQRKDAVAARHDLSGAIGLGVKSELLEELTRIDQSAGRIAIAQGRSILADAEARLRDAGVSDVTSLLRHGSVVETVTAREADATLVIIGKRGSDHQMAQDHIGSSVERVVRASIRPVLIASRWEKLPTSVTIAFDGSASAIKAVAQVAESPLFAGLPVHIVMAGAKGDAHRDRLAPATTRLPDAEVHIIDDSPEKAIAETVAGLGDTMLVMGAYGHSPLRTLIVGSTTTAMVRTVHVPILLVR